MKRLKVFTSYTGHASYSAEARGPMGYIMRPDDIPSPYAYSPSYGVFEWRGKPTICVETAHKRYEVFEVLASETIYPTDDDATAAYIAAKYPDAPAQSFNTELTPQGEQAVIPGCEHETTKANPQGRLW